MGQYYQVVYKNNKGKIKYYDRTLIRDGKGEYTMVKLTEHSWFYNEFVNSMCHQIYNSKNKIRIIWMGDYANEFLDEYPETFNNYDTVDLLNMYEECWHNESTKTLPIKYIDFDLHNKYLINHTKKQFINCSMYYKENVIKEWCIHPLPLLTCIGNGCGGGDYRYPTEDSTPEFVGTWAWDEISIEDNKPENYTQIYPVFKEKGLI